jgi:hypothetical protein
MQGIPGGKVSVPGGRSMSYSKQKKCICALFRTFSEVELIDVIAHLKEHQEALRRATRHVVTRAAECIDVDGGIFKNVCTR